MQRFEVKKVFMLPQLGPHAAAVPPVSKTHGALLLIGGKAGEKKGDTEPVVSRGFAGAAEP